MEKRQNHQPFMSRASAFVRAAIEGASTTLAKRLPEMLRVRIGPPTGT